MQKVLEFNETITIEAKLTDTYNQIKEIQSKENGKNMLYAFELLEKYVCSSLDLLQTQKTLED